jgi:hypothetical protein
VINNNNNTTYNTTKTIRTAYQFFDDRRENRPVLNKRTLMNVKNVYERDCLVDLGIDGRRILKCVLKKQNVKV